MKLFSPTSKSPTSADPTMVVAPGDYFFVRRFDLPAGTAAGEIAGFVELQLEELSPFPLDQLSHGHVVSRDGKAVLVYAAYRRRFSAAETENWTRARFVMPDFAPALRLRYERDAVVLFRSETALTTLRYEGGRDLPVRVASRPLSPEASPELAARARGVLLELIDGSGMPAIDLRVTHAPQQRAQGLVFVLGPDGGRGAAEEVLLPTGECWAMDVRDSAFVAQQRRRLGLDLLLWRILQGAAAALAILLLGELLLLGFRGYAGWMNARVAAQAPIAAALEDKDMVANRLTDFGRSGLSPFSMLATASASKPATVFFTRATAEGRNSLVIDASTQNVADVNSYEAALRRMSEIESVEVRNQRSREDGTTFSLVITFRADVFGRPAGGAVAATGGAQ